MEVQQPLVRDSICKAVIGLTIITLSSGFSATATVSGSGSMLPKNVLLGCVVLGIDCESGIANKSASIL